MCQTEPFNSPPENEEYAITQAISTIEDSHHQSALLRAHLNKILDIIRLIA